MATRDSFVAIASRASAKTWLVAVLACGRAILYPLSEIVVVSSTKEQAGLIIEDKIKNKYIAIWVEGNNTFISGWELEKEELEKLYSSLTREQMNFMFIDFLKRKHPAAVYFNLYNKQTREYVKRVWLI